MNKRITATLFLSVILFTGCNKTEADYMSEGNAAFEQKDYKTAIKLYKKEIKKNPENAQAYTQYCGAVSYAYDTDKKFDLNKTILTCNKAVELAPNDANIHFYKGRVLAKLKKDKEAVEEYTKTIALNPKYDRAYLNRGTVYVDIGKEKEALADFSKAIELNNPEDIIIAYCNRGFTYVKLGNREKANSDFKKAVSIDINDDDAKSYVFRGEAKVQLRDFTNGVFDIKKGIELDDTQVGYYVSLAKAQSLSKDNSGAIETCTKALEKFKDKNEALYMLRGAAEGEMELRDELSNKDKTHDYTKAMADLKMAQQLALKNNNKEVYEASIGMQNLLQEMAMRVRSTSPNVSVSLGGNGVQRTITKSNGQTQITYSSTRTTNSNGFVSKEGTINGICSDDVRVNRNKTLTIRGNMSGDIQVESGATLINHGNISGDVNNNGYVVNHGNMSGDINNNGTLEIYGINTGDINTNKNIYIDKNAIVKGSINRF